MEHGRGAAAFTTLAGLAGRSAWHRRGTLAWVVACIALSTALLMVLERLRADARDSFSQAVSGTDLVVGARTGAVPLMLYSVFHVGSATQTIGMDSLQAIAAHRAVRWLVPLSLGDSHRGYAVLGTTPGYFEHFRHGERQPLAVAQGRPLQDGLDHLYDTVLGADVAAQLGYGLGDKITLRHGAGGLPGAEHADKPFTVAGILARTGTPVDRTVHISLQAMEAIHLDWAGGAPMPGMAIPADQARKFDLSPKRVTAALVGLKSRAAVFNVQRFVADFEGEPLMAVLPGVALDELWAVVGVGERALLGMSAMVGVVSLLGLVAVVLAGLNERRRELAVLRAVGAGPGDLVALLALEGGLVTLLGIAAGLLLAASLVVGAGPWLQAQFGISLRLAVPTPAQWYWLGGVLATGVLASLLPARRAYRLSLADGLSPR